MHPGEDEQDSEHDEPTVPIQDSMAMDIDERDGSRGISETGDAEARKQKRGTYMREGPTVYKLLKPVMKSIKDAQSLE
jgi:hypothetical protein